MSKKVGTVPDALNYIETLQKAGMLKHGYYPEQFTEYLQGPADQLRRWQQVIAELHGIRSSDVWRDAWNRSSRAQVRTLYQCPVGQTMMSASWVALQRHGITRERAPEGTKERPFLATIDCGYLHGEAVRGKDDSYAIVIDISLLWLGLYVAMVFVPFLLKGAGEHPAVSLYHGVREHNPHDERLMLINDLFFSVVCFGIGAAPAVMRGGRHLTVERHQYRYFSDFLKGYQEALLGHEWAHMKLGHTEDQDEATGAWLPDRAQALETAKEGLKKYRPHLALPDDVTVNRYFMRYQIQEHLADSEAIQPILAELLCAPRSAKCFFRAWGAIWAILAIDYLESSIRLRTGGTELATRDLWWIDCLVDDLCLRKVHPNPTSRLLFQLNFSANCAQEMLGPRGRIVPDSFSALIGEMKGQWLFWADAVSQKRNLVGALHPVWFGTLHSSDAIGPASVYQNLRQNFMATRNSRVFVPVPILAVIAD